MKKIIDSEKQGHITLILFEEELTDKSMVYDIQIKDEDTKQGVVICTKDRKQAKIFWDNLGTCSGIILF